MFKITPEHLTEYVNFYDDGRKWHYHKANISGNPDLQETQAEGAAKLWNLLLEKHVALSADEVGMGKTIQGLAVMATLWRQKPNAKVLLYAPNENVAKKWIREYENFIRYHYREADNVVKSVIRGMPLREAVYCENHLQLMQFLNARWPSFFVCKTSSLSGFLSPKLTDNALESTGIDLTQIKDVENASEDEKAQWMYQFGKRCNERAYQLFSTDQPERPPFDLILFDEAHYLRRSEGHSNRSIAAHAFFSRREIRGNEPWSSAHMPIADKVLLLTATPNHSSPADIQNITSLFHPVFKYKEPLEILQEICVRRFRRLEGKSKHEYREEIPESVQMEHLSERLFFAAYHKSLVKAKKKDGQKNRRDNPYSILFGYLEGFEFLPQSSTTKHDEPKQQEGVDFREREDTKVIIQLSETYHQVYQTHPEHPKYRQIIKKLQPTHDNNYTPEKKVVFVRRIASVYEISDRVIHHYDQAFKGFLNLIFTNEQLEKMEKNTRAFFSNLSQGEAEYPDEGGVNSISDPGELTKGVSEIESQFLGLFTIKKEGPYKTTDCSNFRNRFLKKEQIFSVFFEPPADYLNKAYIIKQVLTNSQDKRQYETTVQKIRISEIDTRENIRLLLEQQYEVNNSDLKSDPIQEIQLETLLTIWLNYAPQQTGTVGLIAQAREQYGRFSIAEKEGFSQYLEKGILFASQYVVRFYSMYKAIQAEQQGLRGEDLYKEFCNEVVKMIESSGLSDLIARAALTFQRFFKKELGLTVENITRYNWSFLNNILPVYPYCGETKRESIVKAFNSPFYPDVLVATSVLQEGVDLHYHCSEIIHYGIAWTQGDNEQRVGRVDRMFGKLESRLKANSNATLPIHFPFLKNTIDQDQMARFILRKHQSEQLLDQLKNIQFSSEINFREQITEEVWTECFNKPGARTNIQDPFPVDYKADFSGLRIQKEFKDVHQNILDYLNPLFNTIKEHFKEEFVVFKPADGGKQIFALKHIRHNQRHQPLIGELVYSEQGLYFMNKPVYCLRILTPLAKRSRVLNEIYKYGLLKNNYRNNPLLKICLNKDQKGYLRYYVCTDLPLFAINDNSYNLSQNEVLNAIRTLIGFTDELEQLIYRAGFDIKNEDIVDKDHKPWQSDLSRKLTDDRFEEADEAWVTTKSGMQIYTEIETQIADYEEIYAFNHTQFFLRKHRNRKRTVLQAGLYKNDALKEEYTLLGNILKYVST